ncbi:MAG TPA: helix-turn-helix transcriptional regulator, partial [Chryseolinea sp.]
MSQSFGLYVNRVRRERKVSIADLAGNTGICASDLTKVESGRICASKEMVVRLANYFSESEGELLKLNQASKITTVSHGAEPVQARQTP